MTDDILDDVLDESLNDAHNDWECRLFAITRFLSYAMRAHPNLVEEVEKCSESQLADVVKKYTTRAEFNRFIKYQTSCDLALGENKELIIYANIINYGHPMCKGIAPSSKKVEKMEIIGFSILLTKALNCMKIAMEQLPNIEDSTNE